MKTIGELLAAFDRLDVKLWDDEGHLGYNAPEGVLTPAHLEELRSRKEEILAFLRKAQQQGARPPIQPAPRDFPQPLSFAQQRLWILDQLGFGAAYNAPFNQELFGTLDIETLRRAVGEIVRRHESLRTTFALLEEEACQVMHSAVTMSFPVLDLSHLPETLRDRETRRLVSEEAIQSFDLTADLMLRARLLRLGSQKRSPQKHILLLTMHHIASDGWSLGVFLKELADLYRAFAAGEASPLAELPIQYADFSHWQRQWLRGEVLEEQLDYWKAQLARAPEVLPLPTDRPRAAAKGFQGALAFQRFDGELSLALEGVRQRAGTTLFSTLLAAFQLLMARCSGAADIVVGTPVANRTDHQLEGLIGFFVNTLALRTEVTGEESFLSLLARVGEMTQGALEHQDVPVQWLVEALRPDRQLEYNPFFQVLFQLQHAPPFHIDLPELRLRPLSYAVSVTTFDLEIYLYEIEGRIEGCWVYRTELFDATTVQRTMGQYQTLLEGLCAAPERRLDAVPSLRAAERHQLLVEWNAGHQPALEALRGCVHGQFEAQVERTPEAIAVVFAREWLSYGELDRRANRLAQELQSLGVVPEVMVGLCLERSPLLLVGLLGVLKAGGAYVPLDPNYPAERLRYVMKDAGISVLVASSRQRAWRTLDDAGVLRVDVEGLTSSGVVPSPHSPVTAENLAYSMYTSGSTGRPKGVAIAHRSACALLAWARRAFRPEDLQGVLAATSVSFDLSVFEIFVPLSSGGTVILVENALEPASLAGASRVTLINTVPSAMAELVRMGALPTSVQVVNLAGEVLPQELVDKIHGLGHGHDLWNLYGPSEDTTYSTGVRLPRRGEERKIPIGRPLAGSRSLVVDRRGAPVPLGAVGELLLAGPGLARGYLKKPRRSAASFVPDPYGEVPGGRLYRTGDLVRFLADGQLEFLGRVDHQVKIRGFRIELGEIETLLRAHGAVREAVVVAREESSEGRRLVAYVTLETVDSPSVGAAEGLSSEFGATLRRSLPEYMIPSAFVVLDELPLGPNGKLDREALPAPSAPYRAASHYVAPRTPLEELLVGIWHQLLLPSSEGADSGEAIGVNDDFFKLGGHSLLATRVISRLRQQLGVELAVRELFEAPTVAALAQRVEAARRASRPSLVEHQSADDRPLSFAQERLWFLDQLQPGNVSYHIFGALRLTGVLSLKALRRAFQEVVRRHQVLRTRFLAPTAQEEGPRQVITAPPTSWNLPLVDLQREERRLPDLLRQEAERAFDLGQGPLLRTTLFRRGKQEHVLLLVIHHIVFDGWSIGILTRELGLLYTAYRSGRDASLPELPSQYADFASWQRQWLAGQVLEEQVSYWKKRLAGVRPLELPWDRPRPPVRSFRGKAQTILWSPELSADLEGLSQRQGTTLFMTLLAAFKVLLARSSGQTDLAVGTPIANRTHAETEDLVGFFVNTLVLRTEQKDLSFQELLTQVRVEALAAYAHQDLPFEHLVQELGVTRDLSRTPLFQVMFAWQNAPTEALRFPELTLDSMAVETQTSKFDLTLSMGWKGEKSGASESFAGQFAGSLEYSTELFDATTIVRMMRCFEILLEQVLRSPDQRIADLSLLTAVELHQLLVEWNDTETAPLPAPLIHEVFTAQAERSPEAIALVAGSGVEQVSYGEVERRAEGLAELLRNLGVSRPRAESTVGLCLERSAELVFGLLAILKVGGAYVPLAVDSPPERLHWMLRDAEVSAVITRRGLAEGLDAEPLAEGVQRIDLDALHEVTTTPDRSSRRRKGQALDLAYVMYTSGSTGRPKGVAVSHRSVLRLVVESDFMHLGPQETMLHLAPATFDASTLEIWGPLLNGGRLVLFAPGVPSLADVGAALGRHRISALWLTAGLFHQMIDEELPALRGVRQLLAGGDVLSPSHVRKVVEGLRPRHRLVNGYGPTENTVFTTCHLMSRSVEVVEPIPIGRPIGRTQVVAVDCHGRLVPSGVRGELLVGGDGLARGYHRRPALTAERFVPHPHSRRPGARGYRTGDLVRLRADGAVEFLGRFDDQVKVRGFRIELGEIESVLAENPAVREAVVVAREDHHGDRRLVAYLTPQWLDPEAGGQARLVASELRSSLRQRLPEYMLPSAFVVLDELPITPHGKVDRKALPAPELPGQGEENYVAPRNRVEETLVGIWGQLLRGDDSAAHRVGIHDDFFALGGHSLLATRLISQIRATWGVDLPVRAVFEAPTIAQQARRLEPSLERGAADFVSISRQERDGTPLPLSFAQQRLWFLHQLEPESASYNIPAALSLVGTPRVDALRRSFEEIVRRHEVLRTSFPSRRGQPAQVIAPVGSPWNLPVVDLQASADCSRRGGIDSELRILLRREAARPFDLAGGPLLRTTLFRLAEHKHVLLVAMHHIISDGWSVGVLVRELGALYAALCKAEEPRGLPSLPIQYADFAVWQRHWLKDHVLEDQLAFWRGRLSEESPLELPTDRPRPAVQSFRGNTLAFLLTEELSEGVRSLNQRQGATFFMTLLTAWKVLLARFSGQGYIAVGTPVANRRLREIEDLVGCFVNTLVLRTAVRMRQTFLDLLGTVREEALAAYAHQDLPFEHLVDALSSERDLSRTPLFQVMFILQNAPLDPLRLPGLAIEPMEVSAEVSAFDLTLSMSEAAGRLAAAVEYNTDLFDEATIRRLMRRFEILLAGAVADPGRPLGMLPWMSEAERHQVVREWNDGKMPKAAPHTVPDLFRTQAAQTPETLAVVGDDVQLSYGALAARSGQLAHRLRSRGDRFGVPVAVALERSPELVAAFLGILQAGCIYVPLAPRQPADRLTFLLADAGVEVVFTRTEFSQSLASDGREVICLDAGAWEGDEEEVTLPTLPESALAYIIYTSGSTGRPKGVQVEHHSLAQLWAARQRSTCWPRSRQLRFSWSAAPIFDASIDQLLALCGGHTLEVIGEAVQLDPEVFRDRLLSHRVDFLDLTPRELERLLSAGLYGSGGHGPSTVLVGGEALSPALWRQLATISQARFVNIYGPTEGTIDTSVTPVDRRFPRPHIGRPLDHVRLHVLDRQGQVVPLGIPGELAVSGGGLARGYLGSPGLTAERFVPASGIRPGERRYRTGDRVRQLPDGNIEFLGRLDQQVKVRGYRIELGEIEAVLEEHGAVAASCVVALEERLEAGVSRLVAYLVFSGEKVATDALREHLGARLPKYMVPSLFVELETLPTLPNGKVDRGALERRPVPGRKVPTRTPRTEIERTIATIWQEILGLEKVGAQDNFFEVGGHSLNIVEVRERLRQRLDQDLSIVELFQYPTVGALARHLEPSTSSQATGPGSEEESSARQRHEGGSEIAIIGMAGRFPGANNANKFWSNLREGVESIKFFSREELEAADVDQRLLEQPNYVPAHGALDEVDLFDAEYFEFNPREAALMDPQQRIFLETVVTALEEAGHATDGPGPVVGIYAGASENAYSLAAYQTNSEEPMDLMEGMQTSLGVGRDFLATRVSYKLNLKGPSVTVQTACSTSLVAVHQACQSLLAGDCDLAVAGGVSVAAPRSYGYLYQEGGIFSPDGHCRAFDASAQGCVGGEGVGVVVLRRLADALADGDRIRAVIKGSAINNDGAVKVGYSAPSVEGQAAVIRAAQKVAGVSPASLGYVEAHGTGTPLGDPIEVAALNQAFGEAPAGKISLGAVKTNIGHLDAAAGVAGLIKTVLTLEQGLIPPTLGFEESNGKIDFGAFQVCNKLTPWPRQGTPRRAGVSSFGIGGTNAHVVLEEAPARLDSGPSRPVQLLPLAARTQGALDTAGDALAQHLEGADGLSLPDAAYTLAMGRRHLGHRRIVLGRDPAEVAAALRAGKVLSGMPESAEPSVVFLFPGQGAQYVNMGQTLYREEAVFRQEVDRCAEILTPHLGLDLRTVLYPPEGASPENSQRLGATAHAQPALLTVQWALAQLWKSWGISPWAMIGHSVGEFTAACLADVLSLEDALALVALRGRLMQEQPTGGMLAVPLPEAELQPILASGCDLAAVNGPALCVVAGPESVLASVVEDLAERGVECRRLHTSHAFHSAAMEPAMEPFRQRVASLPLQAPKIPWISNVTGIWITDEQATSAEYWARHLRQPVRFSEGLTTLREAGQAVLLEVGPGKTLGTLARRHPDVPSHQTVLASLPPAPRRESSNTTPKDDPFLLTTLGRLWLAGAQPDWAAFYGSQQRRRIALPTYPFERKKYWLEPSLASGSSFPAAATTGEDGAPSQRLPVEEWFHIPAWTQGPLPTLLPPTDVGHVLIFMEETGLGARLAERLRELGWTVTTVTPGTVFEGSMEIGFRLDPRYGEHYSRLLQEATEGGRPTEILYLWGLSQPKAGRREESSEKLLQRNFYSLFFLAQALGEQGLQDGMTLRVVTGPAQRVTGEEALAPATATALGLTRNLPAEYPGLVCSTLDVVPPAADSGAEDLLVKQLLAEMATPEPEEVVAWRRGMRWLPSWKSISLPDRGPTFARLRPRCVVLITGGLGGIGLALAEELARSVQARLVLTGRSVPPPQETWGSERAREGWEETIRKIEELEALGAEVLVRRADVAQRAEMAVVLAAARRHFGDLHGVIHAAGVPSGGLIQRKTSEEAAAVLAAKVEGTLVLDQLLRGEALDFFLLCSSLSSEVGAPGQADYCAANAFLDAYAHACADREDRRLTVSVNWDTWSEEGMAVAAVRQAQQLRPSAPTSTDPPAARGEPVDHPWLGRRVVREDREEFFTALSTADHWVVDEHRIGGQAVLPGTGYLELIRAAWEHSTARHSAEVGAEVGTETSTGTLEIHDLILIAPLPVEDGAEQEVRTTLRRGPEGFEVVIASRRSGDGKTSDETWMEHARGQVQAATGSVAPQFVVEELRQECPRKTSSASPAAASSSEEVMGFGPRWRTLEMNLRLGTGCSLNHCRLNTDFAEDLETFPLHPALLDGALAVAPGEGFHLPFSYQRIVVHAPLTREVYTMARYEEGAFAEELVSADLFVLDGGGQALLEIEGYTLRRAMVPVGSVEDPSSPPASVSTSVPAVPGDEEVAAEAFLAGGITRREGQEVFRRILAAELNQVLIATRDLESLLQESQALGQVEEQGAESGAGISAQRPDLGTPYVAPRDALEEALAGIWQEVLGLEQVGVEDDFLELGGHSLMATQVLSRLRKSLGVELPLRDFFEASTIADLARAVEGHSDTREPAEAPLVEIREGSL